MKNTQSKKYFTLTPIALACLVAVSGTASANPWWWKPRQPVNPAPAPAPAPAPSVGQNNGYVAPITPTKPNYDRAINQNLVASQPRASAGTRTGYSAMDDINNAQLTQAFFGTDQNGYAARLNNLKNSIDTRNMRVGVIDSGINRNNQDMIGANVHGTQVYCQIKGANNCYLPYDDSGISEMATNVASGHHGSQMASIIAGNNGMTNARIYGSDSIDRNSNGGNQFLMMRRLNDNYGVKIFNNSWGSDNSDTWYRDAQISDYNRNTGAVTYGRTGRITHAELTLPVIHDLILNRDALLIKSSGNENLNDAHDENLAPLINSDFKKGFITVSSPREDFSQANFCGRTADWCLAATSTSTNHDNNGSLATYQGTSPAAARVTGTAVLVKAAYPWMKNENISQTILGTAKDFNTDMPSTYRGLVQVSRVPTGYRGQTFRDSRGNIYIYGDKGWENRQVIKNHNGKNITWESGWGLLDPEAAAKGYGGFYWDNVVLDTAGTPVSVFYNDLKGDKGFTKQGNGKLVFTGNNSYRGDSIIRGGTLEVNGNNGQSIIRLFGGELTGYGTVGMVVQKGGSLNNEGNLTIDNNFSADRNSEFKAKFGNMITVNGWALLDGTISLTGETRDGIISQNGSRSTVLRAKNGVRGQYANQRSTNPLFELTKVEYTPTANSNGTTSGSTNTDVQITARRLQAGNVVRSVSMMDSGARVASNLDKVLANMDKKQETGTLSDDEKSFASRVFSGFENMVATNNATDVSSTLSVVDTNKELYKLDPSVYANTAANTVEVSATNATNFAKKLGNLEERAMWGDVLHQEYDYDLNHSTSERKTNGFNVGVGTKLDTGVVVGAQIDTGKLELVDSVYGINNKTETKLLGLTVGASKSITDKANVTGWLQGANTSTKSNRNGANNSGDFDGRVLGAGVQVASKLNVGSQVEVKPYAFAGYQNYKSNDNYNDGINNINSLSTKQTQIGIGVDAAMMVAPNWEVYGGVQAANTTKKDVKLRTNYAGTSTDVEFEGWDTGKNQVKATIGTNYNITPNAQVGLNYSYTDGKHNDVSAIGANFTMKF
ncbi:MAG: S8 family serine peptidase [Moraxella sp.]|uniref:S8 family serine peptidase n=1 Tax=Moraxella sp. TaxID=479 RepID=UPI0026DC0EC3|nr:S8 family serine peptidase [Moraxella sp.]MDO4450016.1 S8 family serine peptidase [Moraxella sp.]